MSKSLPLLFLISVGKRLNNTPKITSINTQEKSTNCSLFFIFPKKKIFFVAVEIVYKKSQPGSSVGCAFNSRKQIQIGELGIGIPTRESVYITLIHDSL